MRITFGVPDSASRVFKMQRNTEKLKFVLKS